DPFAGEEVADAGLEDEGLLPGRAGPVARPRLVEPVAQPDGHEAPALGHLGAERAGLRADLGPLHVVLGQLAVDLRVARVAVVAPAGGREEIQDVQPEANVAGAGALVEEAPRREAADVAALGDPGLQPVGVDLHPVVGLPYPDGVVRRGLGRGQEEGEPDQNKSHGDPPWAGRRSEERRVGKECRLRGAPYPYKKKKMDGRTREEMRRC